MENYGEYCEDPERSYAASRLHFAHLLDTALHYGKIVMKNVLAEKKVGNGCAVGVLEVLIRNWGKIKCVSEQ